QNRMFTKKDIRTMNIRSITGGFSVNWDRIVHKTFVFMIAPYLKRIYANDKQGYIASLKRNMEFFNVTPQGHAFMGGLTIAMEEQNAKNPDFDPATIPAVKGALMGPLSGILDSIFPGTWRIICAGIGISLALNGNILGPILYALLYNIPSFMFRFAGGQLGYRLGVDFLSKIQKSGLIEKIMSAASILGLMVIGGMSKSMVWTNFAIAFGPDDAKTALQSTLDNIFPGLAALGVIWLFYWLLGRKVNTFVLIILSMAACIVLTALGIMSQ
ncbi:MAG: PTS system mannose/fructose/sorbose family transporter subunit IID, partial [Oscillospiraceae bacterium]|nr:PTS system mannose/fructose/sorbose family transporter subunit IID [Oscillospiraceae bacterium]